MPALVLDERIYETSVTSGTGEYTLAGAVTGFQPASVIGADNYLLGFVTDDTNWEAGIYTYVAGPDRLQRTAVVASSNGDAAVNWSGAAKKIRCGWPAWLAIPRQVSKSVAGAVDVTLTALEQRCNQLILTGALTGNINVIVDTTKWDWAIYNNTSGSFTLTVKTSAGTGIAVAQGRRALLACDGTNVVPAVDYLSTLRLAANPSAALDAATKQYVDAAMPRGYIDGCELANGTDATNDINISAGVVKDSTDSVTITVAAMSGKQLDAGWAPGAAAGMRNSAAAITDATYHIYAVAKADGTQDIYAHTSATVATVITALQAETGGADYLYAQRIGSIIRSGATILAFAQEGDEFLLSTMSLDINTAAASATATNSALQVPAGLKVTALLRGTFTFAGGAGRGCLLSSPDEADIAPVVATGKVTYTNPVDSQYVAGNAQVRTNASREIRVRCTDNNSNLNVNTYGWIDRRGKDS